MRRSCDDRSTICSRYSHIYVHPNKTRLKMPGIIQEPSPEGLTIKELHPSFGAEIEGVDFENLSEAQFVEIKSAMAKVRSH